MVAIRTSRRTDVAGHAIVSGNAESYHIMMPRKREVDDVVDSAGFQAVAKIHRSLLT